MCTNQKVIYDKKRCLPIYLKCGICEECKKEIIEFVKSGVANRLKRFLTDSDYGKD